MKKLFIALLLLSSTISYTQDSEADRILEEGKLLYRMEKASWNATDDFLVRFEAKKELIGGYVSYQNLDNKINTVFFSRVDSDKILVRYEFDSIPKATPIKIDTFNLNATELEKSLFTLRKDAMERAYLNRDSYFKSYQNTSFNFIPLITEKERTVIVLTGPRVSGAVIIGNDYKLKYNSENEYLDQEKIHESMIPLPYESDNREDPSWTLHVHATATYITSTDICTLLLYKDLVQWNQHIVIGEDVVTIFDLELESLVTMERDVWDKVYNVSMEKE